ncbi:23S rRNA pseudouridine2605 synthase [Hymenobacter luteus]|uniref:Pseudouridine synthase n=2 Tax=Hymenobacter TaxID=89966 RepID=A0A7W9WE02_9BACT|nr:MULTISPECIES: pseudouridine synthase [Hymenobacter]MBB4603357.1 23S rRNA pseudouridine2605 synthase [Hymenobacter latericoloratus]MBB6061085.1 23S rRNA pseudouridine2605 synthase [Hymenobacter luteus]
MGKKHFSGDTPGRRGRPTGNSSGGEGFRKFSQPGRNRDERGAGSAPRFGGRDDARGNDRPGFGRPASGSFTGPKKFGGVGGFGSTKKFGAAGGSFSRNNEGRSGSYGQQGGARRFEGGEDRRDERPIRSFEPKKSWQGQPYSQEGKPTVPRGLPGERNRRFVKQNPNSQDEPRTEGFQPREFRDNQSRRPAAEGEREIRPARPFDYRGRPDDLPTDRRAERSDDRRFDRNAGGNDRREFGNRKPGGFGAERREGGFGGGSFGEKRTARPGGFNSPNRREGRSFGEERTGGFRQPRESRSFEERPKRAHDEFKGRGKQTPESNQAGKRKFGEVAGEAPDYKNLKFYEEDKTRGNKRRREEDDLASGEVRLNRYIANAGICSRREADALIAAGEIKVNGEVVTEMGYKVQPSDTVQYGKTNLNREKLVYVLLNKPKDYITTTDDPEGRRTVMELVKSASKERVFPVGRLDRNTTGLLLFTNDGEVAQKLSHPSHRNKKIYQVELDKPLTEEHLRQIAEGLELEDGKAEVDDVAVVAGNPHFVGVEIHIGRNRIVRRIFEHLGYDVVTLDRVQYAGLTKKDLPRGKWRFLTEKEVIRLKYFM